jgi:hypothetical protein
MSIFGRYPDNRDEYKAQVAPNFEAAQQAYPGAVERNGSTWSLTPNLANPGELVLAEDPHDENPHPVHHWLFRKQQ